MRDPQTFESRLTLALQRYTADGPPEVDATALARTIAADARVRHSRGLRVRSSFRLVPSMARALLAAVIIALLAGTALFVGSQLREPTPTPLIPTERGVFTSTGSMSTARRSHTATPLSDGRVLIVGGSAGAWSASTRFVSAEVWDPVTGAFSSAGTLSDVRFGGYTATLLFDDRVLIVGGASFSRVYPLLASAEIWDPGSSSFGPTGSLGEGRGYHTATLLHDGRVLVIGGHAGNPALTSAEVRDPITGAFTPTGTLQEARGAHTATLLPNGSVLVVGGYDVIGEITVASAELWDPITETFSPAGRLVTARAGHTATLLPDGRVLIVGGTIGNSDVSGDSDSVLSAEVWDPETRSFSEIDSLRQVGATTTLLPDGRVLVVGGASADIWDPLTGASGPTGSPVLARSGHTTTLLSDGRVLVVGGDDPANDTGELDDATASAELFELLP